VTTLQVNVIVDEPSRSWQEATVTALVALDGIDLAVGRSTRSADVEIDLRTALKDLGALDTERWRLGFGPQLGPDARDEILRGYVRGRTGLRVALVREPGGAILGEGVVEPGSWWHPSALDRALGSVGGWVVREVSARLAEDRRGLGPSANRNPSASLNPAEGGPQVAEASGGPAAGPDRTDTEASAAGPSGRRRAARRPLLVAATGRRALGIADRLLHHEEWHVGVVRSPVERWLEPTFSPPVLWLPLQPGHFAADPFGIVRDGRLHVFFEDLDQRAGIGNIHHVAVDEDGRPSSSEVVLDPGVHASYPFLVEDAGRVFMLPEIAASGDLVLFEAASFPSRWEPVATLLAGVPALDPTVFRHHDRWWLFATRLDRGANSDLFIWHAERLTGPWTSHRDQPVKTDVRSARPAGTPFLHDGSLYRPSQDSSRRYGGRVVINRVDELTPTRFRETPIRIVEPGPPFGEGVHTLSGAGGWTLLDGKRRPFVAGAFRREIDHYARGAAARLRRS
jgi:hypothetical protein